MEKNMKPICIYHGGCDDGFAAAWSVRDALGDAVEYVAGQYGREPPDVAGRDVIMVDFSYKAPVIEVMRNTARSILILDHHKTAQADLETFGTIGDYGEDWPTWLATVTKMVDANPQLCPTACLFDMARSGAGIAWDFFHPGQARPEFINYIEDRDLWRKSLAGSDEFTIALRSYPMEFAIWDQMVMGDGAQRLISEGYSLQRYYRLRVEEFKRGAYRSTMFFDGGLAGSIEAPCMATNAPYFAASEVAGELSAMDGVAFGLCYFEGSDGSYYYSLRSRGDFDVSEVAKSYGGGGHKNAAGFKSKSPVHRLASQCTDA
jgi:hypothetical protein